jgi:phosphatidylglycerophosphate synthase
VSPSRQRAGALAYAAWMLACVAIASWRREVAWCAAGGLVGLGVRVAAARGSWTPSGKLGLANQLTLVRLLLVASLGAAFVVLPRLGFVALILVLFALDGLDGRLARARGEASGFGAALDMETDALSVMVLGLLLWQHDLVGAWVLVAGLWRYVYTAVVAIVPSLGEAPRTRLGRYVFAALMLCLAGAFLPVPTLPSLLAALGTTLVSISFLHSLAHSSRAASSHERRRGRAA